MGAALYIVVNSPNPGYETFVNGKVLSRTEDRHAAAAEKAGVRPLMHFFSMSRDEAETAAEEFGLPEDAVTEAGDEQWFDPEDGLKTVRALLSQLERNPESLGGDVRGELLEFEAVLTQAKEHGHLWHLSVDY